MYVFSSADAAGWGDKSLSGWDAVKTRQVALDDRDAFVDSNQVSLSRGESNSSNTWSEKKATGWGTGTTTYDIIQHLCLLLYLYHLFY